MDKLQLIIGNKNYSSWSLRPWLVLKYFDIPFEECRFALFTNHWQQNIYQYSPSGKVPALKDGDLQVWDSLAICEYLADRYPHLKLWPTDLIARALARSISAEMHSSFTDLRETMPMNSRKVIVDVERTAACKKDIQRIINIWQQCRETYAAQGEFLLGKFSIADAMYAPVVFRFKTYGIQCPAVADKYMESILAIPAVQQWQQAAVEEQEVIKLMEK